MSRAFQLRCPHAVRLALAAIILVLITWTAVDVSADQSINIDAEGVILHGYDPVAYFRDGRPIKGAPDTSLYHDGATFHFASEDNRNAFAADPSRYTPAFGGFCSYGVRVGKKFDIDPHAWAIVEGRLYMLLDQGTYAVWDKDRTKNIDIATRLWPNIKPVKVDELNR